MDASAEIQDDFLHLEYRVLFPCFGGDRNAACLFSLSLVLGNWYRQGKERKRDSFLSALKTPAVVQAHILCICTLACSILEGGNVNMISLLAASAFLYTALAVIGVKKKSSGREESTVALNWSWNLSSCQFFCNPIRKHFLFKLPYSFHFSCWIYNVPKWFANVLLLWEGLTSCHHYLWNGPLLSKGFHLNLCIKEAKDWLLHRISLKLKIKNRKWPLGSTSCLSHSLPLVAFFLPRKRWLGGEQNVLFGRHIFVGGFFYFFFFFIWVGFLFFLLQLVLSAWLILRKDFSCRECGSLLCK